MSSDKISVFGLGYVGATTAACMAKLGHLVYGVDILKERVDGFNNGRIPFFIDGLDSLVTEQIKAKRLVATTDYKGAIRESDISFVCVQTPCRPDGDIELGAVERTCEQIRQADDNQVIAVRSTVFPSSLMELERVLKYAWAVNPEFLREATAIQDFLKPSFVIVGSRSRKIADRVMGLYDKVRSRKHIVEPETALMLKYACNSWHACKVAFTNEIGAICREEGIDGSGVMKLFVEDTRLNISTAYHRIGEPYGGHCLPKDLSVLQQHADASKYPLIHSISKSNDVRVKK